ncbi:hypothetical protein LEQ06_18730 [Paraclostridium sp. AKS46]|nr:hypothetical protein [Paraclostridium sp. AKS46]
MKNKLIFSLVGILLCIGIFYINLEVLKLDKITGYITSGLIYGLVSQIVYKKIKAK